MRFAATHKSVSYLMVSIAFVMLVLAGEVPGILAALTTLGIVGSYFYDPQAHPFMARRSFAFALYGVLLLSVALLLPDASQGETLWDSGTRFLCVLLCIKLWRRRSNSDYLQAYLISFLMLLIASLVGASIVYAVCLLLYSIFATWTLSLFHLRREMEENYLLKHLPGRHGQAAESERVEVERILSSRRVVGTPFLVTTGSLALVLFLVGGLLFLLLPRVGVGLELPLRRRGLLLTGFAEQIQLGGHGLLRENPRVVMRVELGGTATPGTPGTPGSPPLPQPPPSGLRFRGTAFSYYQDGKWSHQSPPASPASPASPTNTATPLATSAPLPLPERPVPHRQGYHFFDAFTTPQSLHLPQVLRAELYLEPLETSALFVPVLAMPLGQPPPRPLALSLPSSWYYAAQWPLYLGGNDDLIARSRPGSLHYTVFLGPVPGTAGGSQDGLGLQAELVDAAGGALSGQSASYAALMLAEDSPYLQLPKSLAPRLRSLAAQITTGLTQPQDKARALERYLQTGYSYSTQLQPLSESERARHGDPVAAFLFERRRGHCEYFASALSLLLRAAGIPSRSVNGYLGGEWNEFGGYLVVRQQHAHSWVEAYLPLASETGAAPGPGVGTDGSSEAQGAGLPYAWQTLDPTPLSALSPARFGFLQRARRFSDSLEMSWNKYVLEYDPRAQRHLAERMSGLFGVAKERRGSMRLSLRRAAPYLLGGLLLLAGLAAGYIVLRRWRAAGRLPWGEHELDPQGAQQRREVEQAARGQLKRVVATLRRRGFVQRSGETLQALAERVSEAGDPCAAHFQDFVQVYYAHRFGQLSIDLQELSRLSAAMADSPLRARPGEGRAPGP
ncbi:MAG TPA: transglutaminaseTgpA domain-containing protein [Pseudomonadota bacterium]|nr:transglutaminaseTgpA domain-containing protein [Pseudomonadota bacterium]